LNPEEFEKAFIQWGSDVAEMMEGEVVRCLFGKMRAGKERVIQYKIFP
jgi:tRNA A37 threonylcarbamoyladenosine biosynthesis protein TsaE